MLKRYFGVLAILALAIAGFGCSGKTSVKGPADSTGTATAAAGDEFKIGIMTGTVSQGEEDFRAAQQVKAKYGSRVIAVTYPDNFMQEQETVIAQLTGLAADPKVKVIIVGQAVPGSVTAARKIREQRPDILIGFIGPHEDPDVVNTACDLAIQPDQITRGVTIVDEAAAMGAKNFVHYSFPRHMSQLLLAQRRDIMKQECAKKGLKFYFVTATDPMAEGGLPAAQQFILEDVPRQLQRLGKDTAFYTTNDGMQEPLIKALVQAKAGYFVEQDVPAPTAGYPAALGLKIPPDKAGDMAWLNGEIKAHIATLGMSGHFGTWDQPVDMVSIRAFTNLLVDAVDKKADFRDSTTVRKYVEIEAGGPVLLRKYDAKGNQWLVVLPHIVY
ncbi:MAG TPA: DUF3798 domain-containing protein [Candidatus Saccharimonadaceae bacterium]|jgi:hypothetical protein|nr:DUF3798 domain-containing protein [Candidatus Saccharimonadaceae bacterium]